MNSIRDQFANVLGSIGIAALAIAILLVPYSDLNAATNSSIRCVNDGTCVGTVVGDDPCNYSDGGCTPAGCYCIGPNYPVKNEDGIYECPAYCEMPD